MRTERCRFCPLLCSGDMSDMILSRFWTHFWLWISEVILELEMDVFWTSFSEMAVGWIFGLPSGLNRQRNILPLRV
jgi:hypothetical protein